MGISNYIRVGTRRGLRIKTLCRKNYRLRLMKLWLKDGYVVLKDGC
jgi:hypothetical protein